MTGIINGKLLRRQLAAARARGEIDWGVDEATFQFWKANAGNAKARRRWRRRNVPNTQKMAAQRKAEWVNTVIEAAEHHGDVTWAPGIWAGVVPIAAAGAGGEPTMRVTDIDREARTITMERSP